MNDSPARPTAARALAIAGAVTLVLAEIGLLLDVPPFPTWFYVFAWWGWIALADGVVHLRTGGSLLLSRPRALLLLLPWSVAFWLFFETANFVLENWYYVEVPEVRLERLLGISISFATVLPGVIETADLLAAFGIPRLAAGRTFRPGQRFLANMMLAGAACLVLPLLFPEVAYPLIWGATVLMLEPLLCRLGARSHLTLLARGDRTVLVRYLLAGAICGLLWEFWNYWSAAKWIYTVPFFEELKLFEMPVAGFLGFPPFAIGCYTFARFLVAIRFVPEFERDLFDEKRRGDFELRVLGLSATFFVTALVLPRLEANTVRSTEPHVRDLIRDENRLAAIGEPLGFEELVRGLETGELSEVLAVTDHERRALLDEARLLRLAGMGRRGTDWLASVGVYDVEQLAELDDEELLADLAERGKGPGPEPGPREVRVWLRRARDGTR